jgi:hypothetical protein
MSISSAHASSATRLMVSSLSHRAPSSLNGWPAITRAGDARMTRATVPGTSKAVTLRKEAAPLFLNLLSRINAEVLPLDRGPLDSWQYRNARLGGGLSNHASGTAIDFRYDVLKADHLTHLSPAQRAKMEHLLDGYKTSDGHRIFGWGGEWKNGVARDEMHVEVGQAWQVGRAITAADLEAVQHRLQLGADGRTQAGSRPAPHPVPHPASLHLAKLQPGDRNAEVGQLQRALLAHGFNPGPIDGQFGPKTQVAVRALQRSLGFTGHDADGVPGKTSLARLGFRAS